MIKIENTKIEGFGPAIRGMRNPMNSWLNSDSYEGYDCNACGKIDNYGSCRKEDRSEEHCRQYLGWQIGPKDRTLMENLSAAGTDHSKYKRMIIVWVDILAPLYWWKEFDTYKVGTVANSCSTMHKLTEKEFTINDFSHENLLDTGLENLLATIHHLNKDREAYLTWNTDYLHPKKAYWYDMIQTLPTSYNQKRTIMLNYEVLSNIYHARKDHKLDEWHDFCHWVENLPESWIITEKRKF